MTQSQKDINFITALTENKRRYEEDGYLQSLSLGKWLERWADQYGTKTALVEGSERLSYSQLKLKAESVASGLYQLGIRSGDKVLVQLPNSNNFVVLCFALFYLGAWPIMAMPAHREQDIGALCSQAQPKAYIVPDHFLGFNYQTMAKQTQQQYPCLKYIIVDGQTDSCTPFSSLEQSPISFAQPAHTDIALLLLSGGTTGTPKLIPRTHTDYAFNAIESAKVCGLNEDSVYLAALPVSHNFSLACPGILGTLSAGGKVVMARTPGSDETFALIQKEGVTITALVPPLARLWLEAKEWDNTDISSLRLLQVGGSRLETGLAQQIIPVLNCQLQQVFGMAEGLLCYTRLDDSLDTILTTQGRPLSSADQVKIVDPNGKPVATGAVGELLTKGPYTIDGYYKADEHNKKTFTKDGFYQSGDLVRQTPEGNLIVEGRIKEQINRAGEKIAIAEIEQLLNTHPDIDDCVLIPVPDERLGERSCAFINCSNKQYDLQQLQRYLTHKGLPRFKQPDQVEHINIWPLTSVGKINKQRLIQIASSLKNTLVTYKS